jgi:hypothetical protein
MLNLLRDPPKLINHHAYGERERERKRELRNYTKESSFLMTKFKEFNDIRLGMGAADLALVLEDRNPGDGKFGKVFEFGGLGIPAKQSIQFPTHICSPA